MKIYNDVFEKIVSLENLFRAWRNFRSDKHKKPDVQEFEWKLEQNIFQLYEELRGRTYQHRSYSSFYVQDPKQRHIHKAEVRDRILHHAIFSVLNPIFEQTFIPNSFSCRVGKGTHKGVLALENMVKKASKNYSNPCYILKCDVRKYCNRAKLPYMNAHSFRHHRGHHIIKSGGSTSDVMNILGHSSVQSTTIYTMMHGKELEQRARIFLADDPAKLPEQERDRKFSEGLKGMLSFMQNDNQGEEQMTPDAFQMAEHFARQGLFTQRTRFKAKVPYSQYAS